MSTKTQDTPDYSIEEKIIALYDLQQIDSKIDEIDHLKGELPLEVQDLEDEVAGLETRIANLTREYDELLQAIKSRKDDIENSKAMIAKYTEQQNNIRNNREFDSLSKEIEFQTLEIELSEKRIKESTAESKFKKKLIDDSKEVLEGRRIDLSNKKAELDKIDAETAEEIGALKLQSDAASAKIDERLLTAYGRIRHNVRNGLAVVTIKRDACGGCFNRIPPQRQFDIRMNKKIIVCEYCGRILVSDLLDQE
ncbi:MAG: C4-type zinc ribbon domain-containing protein [Rikenellaceae bacterium]|jgi:predicted  nucleic acid-binding Zn-ribbon protein|nr:C4-type zinc ribbon domain-containing protein [Rikenellaceae bacterium]